MRPERKDTGQTNLVLILIFIFIMGFGIYQVYVNFIGASVHHKEAQTAIDAAALAVAKQVGKITVNQEGIGKVGLVDSYDCKGLNAAPVYGINTLIARARLDLLIADQIPNTSMVFLIKKDASNIKEAMKALSKRVTEFVNPGPSSNLTIRDPNTCKDVKLSLGQTAADAYNAVSRAAGGTNLKMSAGDFEIKIGNLSQGGGNSGIPIPEPGNLSQTNLNTVPVSLEGPCGKEDREFYRAYTDYPVKGYEDIKFKFAAVSNNVRLVDTSQFEAFDENAKDPVPPTVVKVKCLRENIVQAQGQQTTKDGSAVQKNVKTEACANVGGPRIATTAGLFRLEFPQGIPTNKGGVNFDNIKGILDESQLPAGASPGQVAGNGDWRGRGRYFTAVNGPFPGDGSIASALFYGRDRDNPSVALAFYLYHWLRDEGLRPRIDSVANSLKFDLRGSTVNSMLFDGQRDILTQPAYAESLCKDCPPVTNTIQGACPGLNFNNPPAGVYGAVFDMAIDSDAAFGPVPPGKPNNPPRPSFDPRALTNFNALGRCVFCDQAYVFRMQMSVPQQLAYAGCTAIAHGKDDKDNPTCVGGDNIFTINRIRLSFGRTQRLALEAYGNGRIVVDQALAAMEPIIARMEELVSQMNYQAALMEQYNDSSATQQQYNQAKAEYDRLNGLYSAEAAALAEERRKFDRGAAVMNNGRNMIRQVNVAIGNMLALSALGLKMDDPNDLTLYTLAKTIRYAEPKCVPTVAAIKGSNPVSTCQRQEGPGNRDWVGVANAIRSTGAPVVIAYAPGGDPFYLPAYAQILGIQQMKNFRYLVCGDSSLCKNKGAVEVKVSNNTPFSNASGVQALLPGQSQWQSLNIYEEPLDGGLKPTPLPGEGILPDIFLSWSMMAQNNTSNPARADIRNPNEEGNVLDCGRKNSGDSCEIVQACDAEAVRFQVTSPNMRTSVPLDPIPVPPPPPGAPEAPQPNPPPPPPPPPPQHH